MRSAPALVALGLVAALAGCGSLSSEPPAGPAANTLTRTSEQGGRFISIVGPRRQHAEPFLGVPGTNFFALRSWIDMRSGETVHQLYVEDSYFGAERNWDTARDAQGRMLKFIPISKNEITCGNGCSYAEEFAARLPEAMLRASTNGLMVTFTARSGAEKTIAVPGRLIAEQLAAVDAARGKVAAATPPLGPATPR